MNLLLFSPTDRIDDHSSGAQRIRVSDHRLENLRHVQQAKPGSRLRVGEINGSMGSGEVTQIDAHGAELVVTLDQNPPPKLPLILIVALPRPKMLRRILRTVAELGVAELHLINSYQVEKSFWQSPLLQADKLESYLLTGLEQARDTRLPALHLHTRFKPFAEDTLPELCRQRQALVAHPTASAECPRHAPDATLLAIGPEGGFTDYEIGKFEQAGCRAVHLGPRILRVENAVNTLIGRLF